MRVFLISALVLTTYFGTSEASLVVGVPLMDYFSHNNALLKLGRELTRRGHNYVHVLPNSLSIQLLETLLEGISVHTYESSLNSKVSDETVVQKFLQMISDWSFQKEQDASSASAKLYSNITRDVFTDSVFLTSLKEMSPDLLLCDVFSQWCTYVGQLLNIPVVTVLTTGFPSPINGFGNQLPQSLLHRLSFRLLGSERSKFSERLSNFFHYCYMDYVWSRETRDKNSVWEKHVQKQSISSHNEDSEGNKATAGISIVPHDFALEVARPLQAKYKVVGAITAQPANIENIPKDIETFLNKSEKVLYASMGTVSYALSDKFTETLAQGFAKLDINVLWKTAKAPLNVGNNTKVVVNWVPQNDILGHHKVKAFLTQCGLPSFMESAYHGKPMIAIPLIYDQPMNAELVTLRKIGVTLKQGDLTPEMIVNSVNEVLKETIQSNAEAVSRLMQDRPRSPREEAVDWIEYAMRHKGAPHLDDSVENWPLYQQYMIDVFLFVGLFCFTIISLMLAIFIKLFQMMIKKLTLVKEKKA